jgi:hypothetical protein
MNGEAPASLRSPSPTKPYKHACTLHELACFCCGWVLHDGARMTAPQSHAVKREHSFGEHSFWPNVNAGTWQRSGRASPGVILLRCGLSMYGESIDFGQ